MTEIPSGRVRALAAICSGLLLGCNAPHVVRPDLVLITVDALRPDHLDCYGGTPGLGAEICALGQTGARYVWAFSPSPFGAPAAASVLTGLPPEEHGVTPGAASFLRDAIVTLPERLAAYGYTSAAFVGSSELNRSRGLQQGFDRYDDIPGDDRPMGERAAAWAENARHPWFLWVHYSEPHGPFRGEQPANPRLYAVEYEAAIRRLDRKLSQLIAVLDSAKTRPGIILAGLHGQETGETKRGFGHGTAVSLEQIRVPLLWRPARAGPGRGVERRITLPVSLLDIAPTLLVEAGAIRTDRLDRPGESPEAAGASNDLAERVGPALPYSDPPAGEVASQQTRTLFAELGLAQAAVRGDEFVALSDPLAEGGPAVSGARLSRHGPEPVPVADPPSVARERAARLLAVGPRTAGEPNRAQLRAGPRSGLGRAPYVD